MLLKTERKTMKKIISLFMVLTMVLSLAACSTNQSPSESTPEEQPDSSAEAQQPTDEAGKTLVVYYSATGNTENVANYIATATDGDLFELEPAEPYSDADLNWTDDNSRVVREHDNPDERDIALVKNTVENWDEYDTIFIGYPIWWYDLPMPVWSFLEEYDLSGKTIIPFFTHNGSSSGANSISTVAELCPDSTVLTDDYFTYSGNNVDEAESAVDEWLTELGYNN